MMYLCDECKKPIQDTDPAVYSGGEIMHERCHLRARLLVTEALLRHYTTLYASSDTTLREARQAVNLQRAGETLPAFRARMQQALTSPLIPEPGFSEDDTQPHQFSEKT
jgi:hypothetical protein